MSARCKKLTIPEAISLVAHEVCKLREQKEKEFEWYKSHAGLATKQDLKETENRLVMNQTELAAGLQKIREQVGKVAKEQSDRFDTLSAEIKKLTDIINTGGDVTPEVTAALADVQTALQSLDDTIPDAPTPPV